MAFSSNLETAETTATSASTATNGTPRGGGADEKEGGDAQLVGSIDAGTTSVRFMVFDSRARVVGSNGVEFTQYFDRPGWQDQDAEEIVACARRCVSEVVRRLEAETKFTRRSIKAIGITNQRETTVAWDSETGKPLYRAIAWPDTRTHALVRELSRSHPQGAEAVKAQTGLPLSTYFAALKLRWLWDNVDAVREAWEGGRLRIGTIDSWLVYNLTAGEVHITDVSNASRTMLVDLRQPLRYDAELVAFFGLPPLRELEARRALPRIRSSAEVYGRVRGGELEGVSIAGIAGDQMAALVGQLCLSPGEAKNTYGTGAFLLYHTGAERVESRNGLLTTVAYQAGAEAEPQYALEGSIAVAGSAVKWLRDSMRLIESAPQIGEEAEKVADTGGVYFVTAFSGLFCPYWDDSATGTLVGVTHHTTRAHLCRATLESVCFQTRDVLEAMQRDSGISLSKLKVDGGMTNSDVCMQIQADLLGLCVERPEMRESTALGSALLAATAVGLFGWDVGAMGKATTTTTTTTEKGSGRAGSAGGGALEALAESREVHRFEPRIDEAQRAQRMRGWRRAVERSRGWREE